MPTLHIYGSPVQVRVVHYEADLEPANDSGEVRLACWNGITGVITISDVVSATRRRETILHELLHVLAAPMEHEQITKLSQELYGALYDNGLLNVGRWDELVTDPA